jgi:hypothetical protein
VLLHHRLQPLGGQVHLEPGDLLDALEVLAEGLVEAVEEGFVLDQRAAAEEVEVFHAVPAEAGLQGLEQGQELFGGHRQLAGLEVQEEVDEHGRASAVALGHEHQPLEEVHVLLVLEQRAVQRRDAGLLVGRAQRLDRDLLGHQQLEPVDELGGGRLLLEAGDFAQAEEDLQRSLSSACLMPGKCTSTMRCMVSRSGNLM